MVPIPTSQEFSSASRKLHTVYNGYRHDGLFKNEYNFEKKSYKKI